ncbi:unnamed protein product [Penicillium salamii]|nr:unnamed protein product [Penicillium salamii]
MLSHMNSAPSTPVLPSAPEDDSDTPVNTPAIAVDDFTDVCRCDGARGVRCLISSRTPTVNSKMTCPISHPCRKVSSISNMKMVDVIAVPDLMPNDEEEQDRMDLTHHIWLMMLKGELYNAPIGESPQNILDLGTGTGIWAMDIADAHVIGNDISPIQPSWVAPNIEFVVEDFESEWQYKRNHFDFIHARCLAGCVADWPQFFRRIFSHVKPGGYFETHESAVWARSDDNSLKENSALMEWQQAVNFAGEKSGRELNVYHKLKNWMIEAGFEDVTLSVYALPFSPWPRDPHLKALGKYQAVQLQQAIDSYSLRLYTQVLGWSSDVAKIHNAVVKQELRDKKLHAYVQTYSSYPP